MESVDLGQAGNWIELSSDCEFSPCVLFDVIGKTNQQV